RGFRYSAVGAALRAHHCEVWQPPGRQFSAPAFVPVPGQATEMTRLEVDRFGVPQYGGEPELYEEYAERCWDLWYGREGSDHQVATPVHLRSGLTSAAYSAVRKLDHTSLITKGSDGKPTDKGIRLLLQTLRDNIEQEAPVKTNELFFQERAGLQKTGRSPGRAFGGLDSREQLNVLASVNNEYDFKKIAHALRIQYPTCSGKPVFRKDYLGCSRVAAAAATAPGKFRPRPFAPRPAKGKGRGYALAVEEDDFDGEEVFLEEGDQDYDEEAYEGGEATDDDPVEALVQDLDFTDDQELAEALATVLQKRKGQGAGSSGKGAPQSFPFRAKGEMTLDQKGKESRRNAVKFLKTVTPCTVCGLKGHWAGDPECQQTRKTGKGSPGASPKKRGFPKKKPSSSSAFYVDGTEDAAQEEEVFITGLLPSPTAKFGVFSNMFELHGAEPESYMVPRADELCQHASYNGGEEKKFHRSANGHVRQVLCKEHECDRAVLEARRKEPLELWRFLTMIILGTMGRKARHRVWTQALHHAELEAAKAKKEAPSLATFQVRLQMAQGDERLTAPSQTKPGDRQTIPGPWIVRHETMEQRIWVYGVCVCASLELPPLPQLAAEDLDILQPVPADDHLLGPSTPYAGRTYVDVASCSECSWWCSQIMAFALGNHPMQPEIYAFGFYLFGRLTLIREAVARMQGHGFYERQLRIPVAMDQHRLDITSEQDCDVMMVGLAGDGAGEELIPSSYVASESDPPGLAILDSGCTKTMHGEAWAERFEKELVALGLSFGTRQRPQLFKGVGGHIKSEVVKVYPVGLAKVHGEMCSSEVPGPLPLLLSRPFMEEMGTVMDIGRGTVSFVALGVADLPLVKTSRGHLAVDLLDFDRAAFTDDGSLPEQALATSTVQAATSSEQGRTSATTATKENEGSPERRYMTQQEIFEMQELCLGDSQEDPEVPEGWNPDDWNDHLDHMHTLRLDVENWEEEERDGGPKGFLTENATEDLNYFEEAMLLTPHAFRKVTNKKGKKLEGLSSAVDSDDFVFRRVLRGKAQVPNKPRAGRTWVKQLYGFGVGFSLLCVLAGMAVAFLPGGTEPETSFNYKARRRIHNDFQVEDPYVTIACLPLPFSQVDPGLNKVLLPKDSHQEHDKYTEFVEKIVVARARAKRHVILAAPRSWSYSEGPGNEEIYKMIDAGDLVAFAAGGAHGPTFLTTLVTLESALQGWSSAKARWHDDRALHEHILDAVVQQAVVEETAVAEIKEAFPLEPVSLRMFRKRKKRGPATLTEQFNAPPVYIRPGDVEPVPPDDATDRTLAELIEEPTGAEHLRYAADGDDHSHRAIMADQLDPVLNMTESERRRRWLALDPEIRKVLRQLHVQFGHPTNTTLQRILRRQGARMSAVKGVDYLSCDACGESHRNRRPKPVRLPGKYEFNAHVQADVFYAKDVNGVLFSFLNVLCEATGFQVVSCMGTSQGPPASSAVLRHFLTSWSNWAGLPSSIQVDRGKEFMGAFASYLKRFGVEQEVMPLEAPWKNGKVEKAGGLWKDVLARVVVDMQVNGLRDMTVATAIVTQVRNSFPRRSGYAPVQWVLGRPDTKLPGSLLQEGDQDRLEILEAAADPHSMMARSLGMREAARVAQIRLDNDGRVRRALLHQAAPTRGPFPVGSYVYFYRAQVLPGASRAYRWHGPARVIGVEIRNQRRLEQPEPATEGGQPHSYWLRFGASVILVTGEQLRFASEDELLAAHSVPEVALPPSYARGAKGYMDLRLPTTRVPPPTTLESTSRAAPRTSVAPSSVAATTRPPPSALVPGTDIVTTPDLLPPVPEDDEGLLDGDGPGQEAPLEPLQNSRTGAGASSSTDGGALSSQEAPLEPRQNSRTGAGAPDVDMHRQSSTVSSAEPEPMPSTPLVGPAPPPAATHQVPQAFHDPDRLDGYRPLRGGRSEAPDPYLAEDVPWDLPPVSHMVREQRLRKMVGDTEEYETDTTDEEEDAEDLFSYLTPADIFLTGKAVRSEIKLKDLSPVEREKFVAAMAKEWSSWEKFNAVEVLTPDQVAQLPGDVRVIGTRWVHTDKNQKQRLLALHVRGKTGKSKEQVMKEYPFAAKSRLVVQGCQEDSRDIRSDSPTASLLAFNFLSAVAVLNGWEVAASDASTAYLQSQGISRLLILRAPRPPPPGLGPNDLLRAKGSIYGTRDAGRQWRKKLYHTLRKHGWRMSSIEAALFILSDGPLLMGIMISHVDDLYSAGEGEAYAGTLKELETELHLTIKKGSFRFCGKNIKQIDGEIFLDQMDAIEGIDYMILPTERRKAVNTPLTEAEKTAFRGLIGQMGWVTRQSRPDLMVNVSLAAQSVSHPKVSDVVRLNRAVKMLKDTSEARWCFRKSDLKLKDAVAFAFADSSFANAEGSKSQCGYVVGLTSPDIFRGGPVPIYIVEAFSGSIKRVCRSTLAAEANGFLSGAEAAEYLRSLLMEVLHPNVSVRDLDQLYLKKKMACFTDARSLEQTLNKDAGQPQDKRVRILIAQVREMIGENTYDDDAPGFATWVDTSQMLADVLTKENCDREPLLHALAEGVWQLDPSDAARERKLLIRAGRHSRKVAKQARAEDG
ncbi:GIP, partial [Symbiodinium sp. CCMP2456]